MNIAEYSIEKKTITLVLTVVAIVGGAAAYDNLGRLEDPEFTIKDALVITPYAGATAAEVEQEVSDVIERAVQQLGQLDEVQSRSERGLSTVTVSIKDKYDKTTLPQVWDELRRKVGDAQGQLPPGAGPSIVIDDYGDVYGAFYALTGEGYSYADLYNTADMLQRELLLVEDVKRIAFYGDQREAIYVEMSRTKMAQLGITQEQIFTALASKNFVVDAGHVQVGAEYIPIRPTGEFSSETQFADLLISGGAGQPLVYLGDVAAIRRGYVEPPQALLRFNGQPAIGLGISTVQGGNVVRVGAAIKERLADLRADMPLGMELRVISLQADSVSAAVSGFVANLVAAIVIVLLVLWVFMGLRPALLIGFILFLTICATLIVMNAQDVLMERISLGALIIALGMLVDNAIVVTDGIQMKINQKEDPTAAARDVVGQTMIPLLGATVVAVLAFAAIGTSQDSTGEYCRSLFQVVLYSLMLSWVSAITVTPLLCVMFLKPAATAGDADPYAGGMFQAYKRFLLFCLRRRGLTCAALLFLLGAALVGFTQVENSFFPDSTRPQFMVNYWLPQGTHIDETERDAARVEEYLQSLPNVTDIATFTGKGGLRFLLTYTPEKSHSSYAQFLVSVDDYSAIAELAPRVQREMEERFAHATTVVNLFALGPSGGAKFEARFSGPDPAVLRSLAEQTIAIYHADGGVRGTRTDWRNRVKVLRPTLLEAQARTAGIERPLVAQTLQMGFDGSPAGLYREGDDLLPIIARPPAAERGDVSELRNLQIWSPAARRMIPITQVLAGFESAFEDPIIVRRDRKRTITVMGDQRTGNASVVFARLKPQVEALTIPDGHALEWGGEFESSGDAQAALASSIPIFIVLMVLIVILLFNALRQPLIIWLCVPLALIGVTAGLLLTGQPFGFMALLGLLSLMGMLIKNAIVLIDQTDVEIREGKAPFHAIVDAGVGRMRPVMMAALTTILGMLPLVRDAFFVPMAVTIMFGLAFATVLTLVAVPTLYAVFFRVPYDASVE